ANDLVPLEVGAGQRSVAAAEVEHTLAGADPLAEGGASLRPGEDERGRPALGVVPPVRLLQALDVHRCERTGSRSSRISAKRAARTSQSRSLPTAPAAAAIRRRSLSSRARFSTAATNSRGVRTSRAAPVPRSSLVTS